MRLLEILWNAYFAAWTWYTKPANNPLNLSMTLGLALVWVVTLVLSVKHPEARTPVTMWIAIGSGFGAVALSMLGMCMLANARDDARQAARAEHARRARLTRLGGR